MAKVEFEQYLYIIPATVKRFPIGVKKEGKETAVVDVKFRSPRSEKVKMDNQAINNANTGHFYGKNTELSWIQEEEGTKYLYVDIKERAKQETTYFEVQVKEDDDITDIKSLTCRCHIIHDFDLFLNNNIVIPQEETEFQTTFSSIENSRFIPAILRKDFTKEQIDPDFVATENKILHTYISPKLLYMEGYINAEIEMPSDEIMNELESEEYYLALKAPYIGNNLRTKVFSSDTGNYKVYLEPESKFFLVTDKDGNKISHKKGDNKKININVDFTGITKYKLF